MHGVETLWKCWVVLFVNSQYRSTTFLAKKLGMVNFQFLRGNSWFKHGSVNVDNLFADFTMSLSTSQVYMIKRKMLVYSNQRLDRPCWMTMNRPCWMTMILAICVVVNEFKCVDIRILELSIIGWIASFVLGLNETNRLLFLLSSQRSRNDIDDCGCLHVKCWWSFLSNMRKTMNRPS